jgi:hypothetical protein
VLLNHIGHYEFAGDLSKMPTFGQPVGQMPEELQGQQLPQALNDAMKMATKRE